MNHNWTTVVIGADRAVLARGSHHQTTPLPHQLADPGQLLASVARLFGSSPDGTLLVQWVPSALWNSPARNGTRTNSSTDEAAHLADFVAAARRAGWHCSDAWQTHGSGWVTFTRPLEQGIPAVHMGVLSIVATDTPLFDVTWAPEQLARQLAIYCAAVGVPYRIAPGVAGCEVIKRWHTHHKSASRAGQREQPTFIWRDGMAMMNGIATPGDLVWRRKPTEAERRMGFVHAYDTNKQYLAAMAALDVSWPAPAREGAVPFDPARAGLWRIVIPKAIRPRVASNGGLVPTLFDPTKMDSHGRVWATTSIVAAYQKQGFPVNVLDSIVAPYIRLVGQRPVSVLHDTGGTQRPGSGRWLREPAERIRDALAQHGRPHGHRRGCRCPSCLLNATLKQTANSAVGMMGAVHSTLRRPDVAAGVRDHARMLQLIKAETAANRHKLYPLQVNRDCVFYASDDPDPYVYEDQLGVVRSGQIGRLKVETDKCTTMDVWLTAEPNYRQRGLRRVAP